jgi:hypothetical protein
MMSEQWDKYYAVTYDGEIFCEGGFTECQEAMLRALDDDCAQMFEVTIEAKEIFL